MGVAGLQALPVALATGSHPTREGGLSAMEVVAWLAGEEHSNHPACACNTISAAVRTVNDLSDQAGRDRLLPLLPRLVNSNIGHEAEFKRAWMAVDWMVRECATAWLDLAYFAEHAATLRNFPPIVSSAEASKVLGPLVTAKLAIMKTSNDMAEKADHLRAHLARSSAVGSVHKSCVDAAMNASRVIPWSRMVAGDVRKISIEAAYAKALAASGGIYMGADSASANLAPTVASLQDSFLRLIERMLETR